MIKQRTGSKILAFFLLLSAIFAGCKKDNNNNPDPNLDFRTYKLFNYSSGAEVEAGNFRIDQLADGNARLTITISEPYRQDGINFDAVINTKDEAENELIFSYLGSVNGKTGSLIVNPVMGSGSNLPVKYSDLISKTGYYIKIMNGANVQATGEIK
ncbi:hypothetical protein [Agriterribacter sp.]|uniref:hypothetical protein n=1 Tax=Agriterribacter sp. TaxID=2821509 RepID=UPI002C0DC690|nr:hypothetical protein [Agriterribacter sp.]HRO45673.1 hypothetical protein [Agriterribacter sp.]HRQ15849.1 hypothetical protein [Agriterribacter sp.]